MGRIIEWFRLEGAFKNHRVQAPCQGQGYLSLGCPKPHQWGSFIQMWFLHVNNLLKFRSLNFVLRKMLSSTAFYYLSWTLISSVFCQAILYTFTIPQPVLFLLLTSFLTLFPSFEFFILFIYVYLY